MAILLAVIFIVSAKDGIADFFGKKVVSREDFDKIESSKQLLRQIEAEKKELELELAGIEKTREDFSQQWRGIREEKEKIKQAWAEIEKNNTKIEFLNIEIIKKDNSIRELTQQLLDANSKNRRYQNIIRDKDEFEKRRFKFENNQKVALRIFKKATLEYQTTYKIFQSICNNRLNNAFDTDLYIRNLNISAEIGSGDHYYEGVTLTKCECDDFKHTKSPCKHMLFLIYSLGVLQMYKEECYKRDNWIQDIYALQGQKKELEKKIKSAKDNQKKTDKKLQALKKSVEKTDKELGELIEKKCSAYPIFAAMYADVYTYYYDLAAQILREKPHPATGEAFRIEELRQHTREHIKEKKILEYKLGAVKQLYPDVDRILNEDFDMDNPPVLYPQIKKHRQSGARKNK